MARLWDARHCMKMQMVHHTLNAFNSFAKLEPILYAANAADTRRETDTSRSRIDGRLIAVKDNICTADGYTTCASKILRGYKSPYNATVTDRLEDAGALIAGKTNMDEFGMGSHSVHSNNGPVLGSKCVPNGDMASAGGSSGGSAVAVATGQCFAALGTDTGGSVRLPAAYCGVVGFKPSYGRISRYGVVAYANSLDTVGILSSKVKDAGQIFQILDHYDRRDPTSLRPGTRARIKANRKHDDEIRIGIPAEYNTKELSPIVRNAWKEAIRECRRFASVKLVSLPTTKQALSVYYLLASAEASSNLAKYDGVRYGKRLDGPDDAAGVLYAATRGAHLGEEVKRRILLGAYTLSSSAKDNYFLQAQRVRRQVVADFDRVFRSANVLSQSGATSDNPDAVDILLCPTAPTLPIAQNLVLSQSVLETYTTDVLTVPASLAGLPAISIPIGPQITSDPVVGMQLIGQFGQDELVLRVAEMLEDVVSVPPVFR